MSDLLDTFFQTFTESSQDNLLSVFDNKTFDDLVNERSNLRKVIDGVIQDGENKGAEGLQEENELFTLLKNAKQDLKDDIYLYNKLKDEDDRLERLHSTLYEVYHDSSRKIDFINSSITNEKVLDISKPLVDTFKIYYDNMFSIIDGEKKNNNELLEGCKNRIKSSIYLYSFTKINSDCHACPICLSNEVEQFCDPCGHCYCKSCLKSTYCYICRVRINKIHKLFF